MNALHTSVLMIAVLFCTLLAVSLILIWKGVLEPSDWLEHPLGLPTGSVRATIALLVILVGVWAVTTEDVAMQSIPEWLTGIMGTVIGFYFGSKGIASHKKEETPTGRIEKLKKLKDKGTITEMEFNDKKRDLLTKI